MSKCHFIPNTHLDREWTLDFQHTRKMTVDFIDELFVIMEKVPGYSFLLDSQAVPIEDYLEVRPEKRDKLREYISSGRIAAGPWYSALDMNCVSGESIVRNMLYGHLTVEPFGPVMKVGYTPFGWGQCSQLPQIYKGFDIHMAFFYRGITKEQAPKAEFIWEGADGTELLTSRFGSGARYNFYFDVWRPSLYGGLDHRLYRRMHWLEDAAPFKLCDEHHRYVHGYVLPEDRTMDGERARESYRALVEKEKKHFSTEHIALMHGMDTSTPDLREMGILELCQQDLEEGESFFMSSMPEYADAVYQALKDKKDLPRVIQEARHLVMNDYGFSYIANDIISARTRQKVLLTEAENTLTRQAEPFAFMAALHGAEWPKPYLDIAWRQLLKCHPHDTIGGCGIDRLEEDSTYRLQDVLSTANVVSSEALLAIQTKIDTSSLPEKSIVLTVYNPCTFERSEVVEAFVDVPRELLCDFDPGDLPESVNGRTFTLKDHTGAIIQHSIEATNHYGKVFRDHADLALQSYADEHRIQFKAEKIPSLGYKTFVLSVDKELETKKTLKSQYELENEFIQATVNADGTVDLLDKLSGEQFVGLNYFEDGGAVGNAWTFVSPANDLLISSEGCRATRTVLEDSTVAQVIRVQLTLDIPATTPAFVDRKDWRQTTREPSNLLKLAITVDYTLLAGQRTLDCKVSFDNQCKNHRLRAMFPSRVASDESFAESPFDVVFRRIPKDDENEYNYVPHLTFPMLRFAGLKTEKRFLAIISGGLKEYEILEDKTRTFALTLHRGFDNYLCTSGGYDNEHSPGELCQGIGKHQYRYAIHPGDTGKGFYKLFREADRFHAPMMVTETKARKGTLPMEASHFHLDNEQIQVSGLIQAARDERLIVRLFNPSDQAQKTTLSFANSLASAEVTNLNEEQLEVLVVKGKTVCVELKAKIIQTVAVTLA